MPPSEEVYVLPLGELLAALWRRAWIIVLVTLVLAGVTVGIGLTRPPVYEASIKILVGQERGITETPTDAAGLQDLTATMVVALDSRSLAETVIQRTGLQITPEAFLAQRLSASQIEGTQFIEVTYSDTDPQRAQRVVNVLGEVFSERNSNTGTINTPVYDQAALPNEPVSPNPIRDGLLAAVIGAILGAGLALLLEFLDDRWRSPEELEESSGVPVFGIIPQFEVPAINKKTKG
jgi:capsular polysaccharide biosynthesis protein